MDFTIPELMATCMAREIKNGYKVLQGLYSPLPMLACLIAKNFHAPDMVYFNTADTIDPEPSYLPFSTAAPKLQERAVAYMPLFQVFDLCQRGEVDLIFLGGAQIDMYGNTNLSVIGEYSKPKVRLPGGAASAHLCGMMKTVIWAARHNPRIFVERVDLITGQGYLSGERSREKEGIPVGGPQKVITNLCIMDFEPGSRKMRLVSLHPGVTLQQVKESTGFELLTPPDVSQTEPPSPEVLEFIRKIDPYKVRELEFQ